jgi:hypothetical protein
MKKTLQSYFILFLSLLAIGQANAQRQAVDSLIKRFDDYRRSNYLEKIYLHVNQSSFLVGETVWFSAYAVDGSTHQGTKVSAVAYVEILDRNNVAVTQGKIELKNGRGSGSFYLSPLINSGNYVIRAYTNWMRNQSPLYYFHKQITIINTFAPLEKKKTNVATVKLVASFFPEGGNLIAGTTNKVGFKVTDTHGRSVSARGALLNDKNDTLLSFSPLRSGIGAFSFQPEAGVTYRALVKDAQGQAAVFDLPKVQSSGHALKVLDSEQQFQVTIENRTGMQAPSIIIVHSRHKITHADIIQDQGHPVTINFNKAELHDGISSITLFNAMMQPVAERLIYKRPTQKFTVTARANQSDYGVRRPVTVDLEASAPANVSISVYRRDSIGTPAEDNIVDYLMLSSDLQGTIESPSYYLTDSKEVNAALDNLMLTHGWRRFNWQDVVNRKKENIAFIPEVNGPIVTAKILNEANEPASGILAYLATPSKSPRLFPSRSDVSGKIQFDVQNLYGPRNVVIQPNNKSDSAYHIVLENSFSTDFAPFNPSDLHLSPSLKEELQERSLAMQVEDIYHRTRLEKFLPADIDSVPFYGTPDERYHLDDFTRFTVMEEVMREYVPGVLVRKRRDGFHFIVLDAPNKAAFNGSPLMLIDGVPFFDEDEIMSFDPLKIKTLDVMTQRYYIGVNHYPGLVSYRTYQGDLAGFKINKHALVVDFEGLQLQREFYVPKYDLQKERESRLPDQRQQLYWNPQLILSKDGKQQITFTTGDLTGEYLIVVEGLSKDGVPGATSTSFNIKNYNN